MFAMQPPPYCFLFRAVLLNQLGLDALELGLRQDGQQLPAQIQRLLNGAVFVVALVDVALFKLVGKLGIQQVVVRQRGFAQNGHQLLGFLAGGIRGEELVHGVGVVLPGLALADALVLQTGQAGSTSTGGLMPLRYSPRERMIWPSVI
jgi:hypothetical protein